MNTNYDDDATQLQNPDNETNQQETSSTDLQTTDGTSSEDDVEAQPVKYSGWKRAGVGAASGLLIGGVATFLMGMKEADNDSGSIGPHDNHRDHLTHPEWVDDQMQVATGVNDDMSFGEAFAAARAEVGPGGCFEWHGQVYGTYTADEWNSMTPAERAEFGSHFSWNHIDSSSSDVASHSTTSHAAHTATASAGSGDDIEIVSVTHDEHRNNTAHTGTDTSGNGNGVTGTEEVEVQIQEPEIEILGVVHDSETGANIGGMLVDNQEVILIDVDGDMEFDFMGADVNNNGQLDSDEVVDIHGQGMTVAQLGGFSDPVTDPTAGDMLGSNDAPDYTSDVYEA